MTTRTWHKGPPPHVGWWNASYFRSDFSWRWWDGECWSHICYEFMNSREAKNEAKKSLSIHGIEWTDYYPENARVPRVDPGAAS